MAANKTNYMRDAVVNISRGNTFTAPTKVYLALWIGDPTVTGAAGAEVTGGGYARQEIVWDAPTPPGETQNAAITFPIATANYGTVTHLVQFDAVTGGNPMYFGPWTASKAINIDDVAQVLVGELELDET